MQEEPEQILFWSQTSSFFYSSKRLFYLFEVWCKKNLLKVEIHEYYDFTEYIQSVKLIAFN